MLEDLGSDNGGTIEQIVTLHLRRECYIFTDTSTHELDG
jgi:hypothetical protein